MMNISPIVNSVKCTVFTRFLQYLRRAIIHLYCTRYSIIQVQRRKYLYSFFTLGSESEKNVCTFVCAVVGCVAVVALYCVLPVVLI